MLWWETKSFAWGELIVGVGGGGLLSYISPIIGVPVCIIMVGFGIFLMIRAYSRKPFKDMPATQLYDIEQGKHISLIKGNLISWGERLEALLKGNNLNLYPAMNDTQEFIFARQHCPSIDGYYSGWLISIGITEYILNDMVAKKANHQDIAEQREIIRTRLKEMVKLINTSITTNEYLRNHCYYCPKKLAT